MKQLWWMYPDPPPVTRLLTPHQKEKLMADTKEAVDHTIALIKKAADPKAGAFALMEQLATVAKQNAGNILAINASMDAFMQRGEEIMKAIGDAGKPDQAEAETTVPPTPKMTTAEKTSKLKS